MWQRVAVYDSVLQCVVTCIPIFREMSKLLLLQCVAVCYFALPCVAVRYSVMQCVAV